MAGPARLPRDFLDTRRAPFSGAYQMAPDDFFPIPAPERHDRALDRYVPVQVDEALRQRAVAQRRAQLLRRLAELNQFEDDEEERLARIEAAIDGYGLDNQPVALFYLLGYTIDDRYLVRGDRAIELDELLDSVIDIRSAQRRNRASLLLAPRREFYSDMRMLLREQTERLNDFTINVVKPIAEVEAIMLREAFIFIIGGAVIRGGAWVLQWLLGLRRVQRLTMLLGALRLYSGSATTRGALLVLTLVRRFLTGLGKLLLLALSVKGTIGVAIEILDQLAIIHRYIAGVKQSHDEIHAEGGMILEGWEVSADPLEQEMIDYLQSTLPQDVGAE